MKFKEVFLLSEVVERSAKVPYLEAICHVRNFKNELKKYVFKVFGDDCKTAKEAKGSLIVADVIILESSNEYCSNAMLKNIYILKKKPTAERRNDSDRCYDPTVD